MKSPKHQKGFIQVEDPSEQAVSLSFPRVVSYCHGAMGAWSNDSPEGEYMRDGMSRCDALVLNMNTNIISDTNTTDYLSRQNIVKDLKARNPDLIVVDYNSQSGTSNDADPGSSGEQNYLGQHANTPAQTGWLTQDHGELQDGSDDPEGTDLLFYASTGIPVADWWGRIPDGTKKAQFRGNYTINICPTFTLPDADGYRRSEWYFHHIALPDRYEPHEIVNGGLGLSEDGCNVFFDVTRRTPKSSKVDFNGDGIADEADTYFDAHDPAHRIAPDTLIGGGGVSAADWRLGHRNYWEVFIARWPDIIKLCNLTDWFPNNNETTGSLIGQEDVQPEYQFVKGTSYPTLTNDYPRSTLMQGGAIENFTGQLDMAATVTGLNSDGTIRYAIPAGWQRAYNMYRYGVEVCAEPKIVAAMYWIQATDVIGQAPNGRNNWSWEPHPTTPFHMHRWFLAMVLMDNGYVCPCPTTWDSDAGEYNSPMIFDEYGTVNTGTTGLTRGWLGQPLEGPVTVPFGGSGDHRLLKREFENGLVIATTSKTSNLLVPVSAVGGAGVWKFISGVQDSARNDGSVVNSDKILPPIDGFIWQRV